MKKILAALALAFAGASAFAQAPGNDAQVCSRATADPEQLIAACTRALAGAGTDKLTRVNLQSSRAIAYLKKGDLDRGIADLDAVIALSPDPVYYELRGMQWQAKKNDEKAVADFDEAVRLGSYSKTVRLNRAFSLLILHRTEKALADFDQVLQDQPDSVDGHFGRGLARQAMGDYRGAIDDFDAALKRAPERRDIAASRANAVAAQGSAAAPAAGSWAAVMQEAQTLNKRFDLAGAERAYERALGLTENTPGREAQQRAADSLRALVTVKRQLFKLEEAERLAQRCLAQDKLLVAPDSAVLGDDLVAIAAVQRLRGAPAQALETAKQALAIHEKAPGPSSRGLIRSLDETGLGLGASGDYLAAGSRFRRALELAENMLGPNDPVVADILVDLGSVLRREGRSAMAIPLYARAVDIQTRAYGGTAPPLGSTGIGIAAMATELNRYQLAETGYPPLLEILRNGYGADSPEYARAQMGLGVLYGKTGRLPQGQAQIEQALQTLTRRLGEAHPLTVEATMALAVNQFGQRRYKEALALFARATAESKKLYGAEAPEVALGQAWQSRCYMWLGDAPKALAAAQPGSLINIKRLQRAGLDPAGVNRSEQRTYGDQYRTHLTALFAVVGADGALARQYGEDAFLLFQAVKDTDTAGAVTSMALRYARADPVLAQQARERQELLAQWREADEALLLQAALPPEKRNRAEEKKRRDQAAATEAMATIAGLSLGQRFPEYEAAAESRLASLREVQALLGEKEAMLTYVVADNNSYLMVLRRTGTYMVRLDVTRAELARQVAALRRGLDLGDPNPRAFSLAEAHALYKQVFAPGEVALKGAEHIMVVPDGALASLPLSVLVATPPPDDRSENPYARADWLARKYAFTTLPAESSLVALRKLAKSAPGSAPFEGFGNPVLEGDGANRGRPALAKLVPRGGVADVREVRKLAPLPETALEINAFASFLGAPAKSVHLGAQATETAIKRMDLSNTRVIAFATHGLVAGDFEGVQEPALALTPPAAGTKEDDGLLTASEISQLKLNADWVILSACNTAAADGAPGAEGLSGLARAFFYAGSRSLLVSHWPVASEPTVLLTTRMLKESTAPGVSKAEALRRSIVALIDDRRNPKLAYPSIWAPFVIVGEGGR